MTPPADASASIAEGFAQGDDGRPAVIYVGAFRFPDGNAAAQRALANAKILECLGFRPVLVGIGAEGAVRVAAPARRVAPAGIPFECWETPAPTSALSWFRRIVGIADVRLVSRAQTGKVAAIICYDYAAVAQTRIRRFCRRMGALAIAEVAEWYSVQKNDSLISVVRNFDRPARMRWVNPSMDGLIVTSEFLRDFYRRASDAPVVELPTLMSERPAQAALRGTADGSPKRLVCSYLGFDPKAIASAKEGPKERIDKIIEALAIAKSLGAWFHLEIFGVERESYLLAWPEHRTLLADLDGDLTFRGVQPRAIVREAVRRADFTMLLRSPNIVTLAGFPTKFAESINFGTPVITNRVGSLTTYHEVGKTGHYIDLTNVNNAGAQLKEILRATEVEISKMKQYCSASEMFYYETYVSRLQGFFAAMTSVE